MRKLASLIAKREGKKHQASIADIREILKILIELEIETEGQVSIAINSAAIKILEKIAAKRKKVKK